MDTKKRFPAIIIQSDWNVVLRKHNKEAWIYAKYLNELSINGKLQSDVHDAKIKVSGCDKFQVMTFTTYAITVKHLESGLTVAFVSPTKNYNCHAKSVNSLTASENALIASCSDNKFILWDTLTVDIVHTLVGHAGPVYKCRFFPSGLVILSAGADTTLRIWSAETGLCPVILKGHGMAVTDIAIIDRGRNVVSVSKDGFAYLWDVGESKILDNVISGNGQLNCCCLVNTQEKHEVQNEREIGTSDKLLIAGSESGSLFCHHLGSRVYKYSKQFPSAINCCVTIDENKIVVGCEDGLVTVVSAEDGTTIEEWSESASPVRSILVIPANSFIVGRQDGTCIVISLHKEHDTLRVLLTGSDCDPIYDMSFNSRWVFTCSRDSEIRKYDINQINVHFK